MNDSLWFQLREEFRIHLDSSIFVLKHQQKKIKMMNKIAFARLVVLDLNTSEDRMQS